MVFEKGVRTSYAACGIPFHVGGEVPDVESLVARSPEVFRSRQDIDVRLRHEATAIDLDARTVEARDLEDDVTVSLGFDQLDVRHRGPTGAPPWPGVDLPHVHMAHTLSDASGLAAAAADIEGRPVAVVGGGYIGLEMAEAFLARGARVTVVRHRGAAAAQPRRRHGRPRRRRGRATRHRAATGTTTSPPSNPAA